MKKTLAAAALATTLVLAKEKTGMDERFLFVPPPPAPNKMSERFEYEDRERFRFEFSKGTGRNNLQFGKNGRPNPGKKGR